MQKNENEVPTYSVPCEDLSVYSWKAFNSIVLIKNKIKSFPFCVPNRLAKISNRLDLRFSQDFMKSR